MGGLSWWHWLIIIAAFVLLFGAKKLPDAARGIGRSMRILKSEVSAMQDDDAKKKDAEPVAPVTPPVPPTAQIPPVAAEPIVPVTPAPVTPAHVDQHRAG